MYRSVHWCVLVIISLVGSVQMLALLCARHYLLGRSAQMWALVCAGHYLLGQSAQMWALVCAGHYLLDRECTDVVIVEC